MLKGKKILLGITGSIAAYKAATLARLLVKQEAEVQVVMTPLAREFITSLTMATLSKNPVLIDFFNPENGDWNSHVDLGTWSDLYLIAPATANTIAKMAHGVADNLLLTTYLSARCPVFIAPAMDLDMYNHPSTLKNIEILKSYGNQIIESGTGELASGLIGKGRMEEPEKIVEMISDFFGPKKKNKTLLTGKKFLITAGPTYESIDPVRFIGNHSSGKMGIALAESAAEMGAKVELILGPGSVLPSVKGIAVTHVFSANEMYEACMKIFPDTDCAIMAAAVSDFEPETVHNQKMKRRKEDLIIRLKPTRDIAFSLGKIKKSGQLLIGFALETHDEIKNARKKLRKKNFDFIVLNSLGDPGAGFGYDTNKISILDQDNNIQHFELKSKRDVARDILDKVEEHLKLNR
jgi:phosphopantothenoylcysteine decarboxylase/phosphopantothenate--cysteine ligase